MKAIDAVAGTQAPRLPRLRPQLLTSAGLAPGFMGLLLGLPGAASKGAKLIGHPVVVGFILGLGMGFMLKGVKMMASNWLISSRGFARTKLLIANRTFFLAMLLLPLFGVLCGGIQNP